MDRSNFAELSRRFAEAFGPPAPRVFRAAGRVNLIGGHVDYHGGPVIPIPIDRGVGVAARLREDRRVRLCSRDFPGSYEWSLDELPEAAAAGWSAYPLGALAILAGKYPGLRGADLCFLGTVPGGAGLSSSAAVLVATLAAASELQGLGLGAREMAELAHAAETGYVGLRCGIMDQYASALARDGCALYLDCATRESEHLKLPAQQLVVCVLDSMTRHELVSGGYNERVAESGAAWTKLKRALPERPCLAQVETTELLEHRGLLGELEYRRARHVVSESQRVREGRRALQEGDLLRFGGLMTLSHLSSRDHYDTTTPRLDALHELALSCSGVHGARVTGAGFGGCIAALVARGTEQETCQRVADGFAERFDEVPAVHVLGFGEAPGEVVVEG